MKIAVPKDGNLISSHFGHSEGFVVFEIDNDTIKSQKTIMNGDLKGREMAILLADYHVDTMIVGGIGENAKNNLEKNKIKVLVGANGNIDKIIQDYIDGNLFLNNEVCTEHEPNHNHTH